MKRGEIFLVAHPSADPKRRRAFVVVSRQALIDSALSTVICAPIYSSRHGLPTQLEVGPPEGLKHDCSVHCDKLVSVGKSALTHYVGRIGPAKLPQLDAALACALGLI